MRKTAQVQRLPMTGPGDVSAIAACINEKIIEPQRIVAIVGKTEGNGCVNDFTRGYAVQSIRAMLSAWLAPEVLCTLPLIMSGGTEGGLSPHWLVLHTTDQALDSSADNKSLAIASAITRPLDPTEIGRLTQCDLVCDAVKQAIAAAEIDNSDDVHFVQIKCPLLTSERTNGLDCVTDNTLKSMALSRGASAIGVAMALKELSIPATDEAIGCDYSLWSSRASCSAGIELMACEVVVLGMSAHWAGPLAVDHCVMKDAIDTEATTVLLQRACPDQSAAYKGSIKAVLAKAEASSTGQIRGSRHTMLEDSDISSTRHARAFVGGVLAGQTGHTDLFVSGGAEHQGPDGGGPVAIIYEKQRHENNT